MEYNKQCVILADAGAILTSGRVLSLTVAAAGQRLPVVLSQTAAHIICNQHVLRLCCCCPQAAGKADAVRTALIETDSQGVGYLAGEQLDQALSRAGLKFTRHQAISLKRRLDRNNTGTISIEEFLGLLGL